MFRITLNILVPDTSQVSAKCRNAFNVYQNDKCIIYDDVRCDDKDFGVGLKAGEKRSFDSRAKVNNVELRNNVEAISVQQGCSVQIWTGTENMYDFNALFYHKTKI